MTSSSYHNGVSESRTYNNDNTVASISFTGAAIGNLAYTWDANLNKTSETIGGVMSGYGFTAGYDDEDRLTSWDRADNTLDQAWNLSPVGDWNSITQNSTVQNRTHGPVHELLTAAGESLTYDAKGNMTLIPLSLRSSSDPLTMSWDFNNKLRGADTDDDGIEDVFYIWDALGRRVGRTANSATTIYFQDGQQTLADYASGASASSPTYIYLFASYIDEVVLRSGGSGLVYYHRNQQYSITALSDASGTIIERYAYTAYGTPTITDASGTTRTTTAVVNRYTYTGREWDETLALYHYRARMYDAVGGRFVSRDPIGYVDGASLYMSYTSISALDPSGTVVVEITPESHVQHPWTNEPDLGYRVFGSTSVFVWVEPICSEIIEHRFTGGGVGAGYFPAEQKCVGCKATFRLSMKTTIKIDVQKIARHPGRTKEGVYGHEQLHVLSFHGWAYRMAQSLSAFEIQYRDCRDCERMGQFRAQQAMDDFDAIPDGFNAKERRHSNPSSPFEGVDYPPIGIMPANS
jgi:RHS repeat-associated protein